MAADSPLPLPALLAKARAGERRALARMISAIERGEGLPGIPFTGADADNSLCIGITGAPGAGKSTLVSELVERLLVDADSVAVLAVDPSSPISRGALLGDRVRMQRHATSPRVFIRSMATRSHQGGLAGATQASRRLLQYCGWSLVLIETVGVGQVELDVVNTADLAIVVLNPGWGDEIQANKAGLMEIADIFVINKADRPGLETTRRDIDAVIANRPKNERPPVIETVASEGQGIDELSAAISSVHGALRASGELQRRRQGQLQMELSQQLRRRFSSALNEHRKSDAFRTQIAALVAGEGNMEMAADQLIVELLDSMQD
ncbi:MAG: LAO/AO transport system kinase [Halieaceae bacterium]